MKAEVIFDGDAPVLTILVDNREFTVRTLEKEHAQAIAKAINAVVAPQITTIEGTAIETGTNRLLENGVTNG